MEFIWRVLLWIMLLLVGMQQKVMSNAPFNNLNDDKVFVINNYDIWFSFPNEWERVTKDTPFDMQCEDSQSYASIFVFDKIDLAEGQTSYDIYKMQTDDLLARRENVMKLSEEIVYDVNNKRIHSQLYAAERNGIKNYYYFNLIEFKEQDDQFCWMLFTSEPSNANLDDWKAIIASAEMQK